MSILIFFRKLDFLNNKEKYIYFFINLLSFDEEYLHKNIKLIIFLLQQTQI